MAGTTPDWNPQSWAPGPNGSWQPPDYAVRATGQIDGSEIASLAVDQLTAGTLRSAVILGGSIKTGLTGARVEQDASGIRLYDAGNVLKVNLDATTGNGTFTGTVSASTITGATITGGTITGTTITGGTIQTAASGHRTLLDGTLGGSLRLFTADSNEVVPAFVYNAIDGASQTEQLVMLTGQLTGGGRGTFKLISGNIGGSVPPYAFFDSGGNVALGDAFTTFGGGQGVMVIQSALAAPTSSYLAGGILYVVAGALKYRGSAGTVTTIAAA